MRMRKVGNTDLMVSEICLGTGSFGGVGMYRMSGNIQQEEANEIVSAALDSGINFFDTAELRRRSLGKHWNPAEKRLLLLPRWRRSGRTETAEHPNC